MAGSALADAGFLVALLSRRDRNHRWAALQSERLVLPWTTCEAALSEAFNLLGAVGRPALSELLRHGAVVPRFELRSELPRVLKLMQKYASVPMSLADACLVRMSEILADPVVLTTDSDFRVYRRHSRQDIPCILPD